MAKKLKISVSQTQTIREAFDDFLLQKKALGLADKTIETYSHHFGIISKYLDSSAPIAGLFKRPLDEMIERMRSAGMKDTSINRYTRMLNGFLLRYSARIPKSEGVNHDRPRQGIPGGGGADAACIPTGNELVVDFAALTRPHPQPP